MKNSCSSFSLVEVVIAMGVVSIGLVSIMGLLPAGLTASRDTNSETRAAQIAQTVFATLRAQPYTNAFLQDVGIPLQTASTNTFIVDEAGEFLAPDQAARAIYYLELICNTNTMPYPSGNISQVELIVRWQPTSQSALSFVTLMGSQ